MCLVVWALRSAFQDSFHLCLNGWEVRQELEGPFGEESGLGVQALNQVGEVDIPSDARQKLEGGFGPHEDLI